MSFPAMQTEVVLATLQEMGFQPTNMDCMSVGFQVHGVRAARANGRANFCKKKDPAMQGPVAPNTATSTVSLGHLEKQPPPADYDQKNPMALVRGSKPHNNPAQGEAQDCHPSECQWHWLGAISDGGELEIQKHLGKGTFGTVYATRFQGATYALKLLPLDPLKSLGRQHPYEELVALQEFGGAHYPGIVNCLGYFATPFNIQFLTELFDLDLAHFNEHHHFGITENDAKSICRCIATGLCHMHSKGYVHRDIKQSNVFIRSGPHSVAAAIGDLGCAFKGEGAKEHVTTVTHKAPELFHGGGYMFPCDVWSFGLVCMEVENKRALHRLQSGIGDWEKKGNQSLYLSRLLWMLTGGSGCSMDALHPSLGSRPLPLAHGVQSAFGKRFTKPSFQRCVLGLLPLEPHKRNTITEVSGCHWLQQMEL